MSTFNEVFVVLVIFLVLIALLVGILLVPIELVLDTRHNSYYVRLKGLVKLEPELSDSGVALRIRIPFYSFRTSFFDGKKQTKKASKQDDKPTDKKGKYKEQEKKRSRRPLRYYLGFVRAVLRSFQVPVCYVNIDTDDYVLNAQLTPIFALISHPPVDLRTNFEGRAELHVVVRNRLWNVGTSVLRYVIRNRNVKN